MSERINIKEEKGRVLGWLIPHPSGNGYVGEFKYDGLEPISYFGASLHDATMWFTRAIENQGFRMTKPSNMFGWTLIRDSNGFFLGMPSPMESDDILIRNISADECWEISKRANEVRSFFGPRMNKCTLEQVWELEARMKS